MSETSTNPNVQAGVAWRTLLWDVLIIVIAIAWPIISFFIDLCTNQAEWFHRSGAITVLIAAALAFRSLTRHYKKFYNNMIRGYPLDTSKPQSIVDRITLFLSIAGTLIWAYGDKLLK